LRPNNRNGAVEVGPLGEQLAVQLHVSRKSWRGKEKETRNKEERTIITITEDYKQKERTQKTRKQTDRQTDL
jgi:hypothetical protein